MANINAKFVSRKISKVKWRPTEKNTLQNSDTFVTGSWDDKQNKVCVWRLRRSAENINDYEEHTGSRVSPPVSEPQLLAEIVHTGDVTDLQYLNSLHILAASSSGTVHMYRHNENFQNLAAVHSWKHLHHYGEKSCPCTGLSLRDEMMVTVGEDGRINVISLDQMKTVRILDNADSCTLNAVQFLKQFEILTVNSIGRLKVWDLRQSTDSPTRSLHVAGDCVPMMCLDRHPNQPHLVATGAQDGMIWMWDMRQDRTPVSSLGDHSAEVSEVKFHPTSPDNLFTCSEDGAVWHWDATNLSSTSAVMTQGKAHDTVSLLSSSLNPAGIAADRSDASSAWLASDAIKHRLEVTDLLSGKNLMPVNSIDIQNNILLCGTDAESILTISNLVIK